MRMSSLKTSKLNQREYSRLFPMILCLFKSLLSKKHILELMEILQSEQLRPLLLESMIAHLLEYSVTTVLQRWWSRNDISGAGKTTLIHMLIGLFPPSNGDAYVSGKNLTSELNQIHTLMGICPQHDVMHLYVEYLLFKGNLGESYWTRTPDVLWKNQRTFWQSSEDESEGMP